MNKKLIIIGNLKMNLSLKEIIFYIINIIKKIKYINKSKIDITLSVPYIFLHISHCLTLGSNLHIASQNMFYEDFGEYTGEISAKMLKSIGINRIILGHSERRKYFFETNKILKKKILQALKYNFKIFFCVGEKIEDRKNKKHYDIIYKQIKETIFSICSYKQLKSIIIAYEPLWAIGTGKTASIKQIKKMHTYIKNIFVKKYGKSIFSKIKILYGGSINIKNNNIIFSQKNVDGGLIGKSSLTEENFFKIIQSSL
jgi:triosephosphate isomerase